MSREWVSSCCFDRMIVAHSQGGSTCWYQCLKCGNPCDSRQSSKIEQIVPRETLESKKDASL